MKKRSSYNLSWIEFRAFLIVLAVASLVLIAPHSTAQQDNRQLKRDQTQPNGASARRLALVIGNGTYTHAPPLKNPPNDARDMAATLKELGFEVSSGIDVNQRDMKRLIREFGQTLKSGGSGLFYYAGHGVQSKGHNYLIPVDSDIQSEAEVEDSGVDVNLVLNYMDEAQNSLNIVILDACRNNPFARSFRSASNGLAQVDAPTGSLIAYSTAPGRVASDGIGQNGLYTSELLKQMRVPGLSATEMFMHVRAEVMKQTANKQVPWEASSLVGTFYFSNNPASSPGKKSKDSEPSQPATIDAVAVEREYWETIRNSSDPQDYKDYIETYPKGAYAAIARSKIRQLETAKNSQPSNSQPSNSPSSLGADKQPNRPASTTKTTASRPKSFTTQQGIEMVYVPPGEFIMGEDKGGDVNFTLNPLDERPKHRVSITHGFYMGKYEVTQAQWQSVMGTNPSRFKGDSLPVETVSWDDAVAFVARLNAQNDGFTYRLPTEAEWEYACRAATTGDYAGDLDAMAWYANNSGRKQLDAAEIFRTDSSTLYDKLIENGDQSHAVGTKLPNAFSLFDMHGNISEWCQDLYHDSYIGAPGDGSAWLIGGTSNYRVFRGGNWGLAKLALRSASRDGAAQDTRISIVGIRVVAVERTSGSQPENTKPANSGGKTVSDPTSAAKTSASLPKSFTNKHGMEMVYVPAGEFRMGSTKADADEKPVHRVVFSQGFYIGKYEITQGQWRALMGRNPSNFKDSDNLPVEQVSWTDAKEFVNKLNELNDGYWYRLPSEAEWEYACRAGTTEEYYSKNLDDIAWYEDNSGGRTHIVGGKQPNAFGLYDMSGNVWEWCMDWFHEDYKGAPTDGSAWVTRGSEEVRVLRGGSWGFNPSRLRSAIRGRVAPDASANRTIGVRVVAVVRAQ